MTATRVRKETERYVISTFSSLRKDILPSSFFFLSLSICLVVCRSAASLSVRRRKNDNRSRKLHQDVFFSIPERTAADHSHLTHTGRKKKQDGERILCLVSWRKTKHREKEQEKWKRRFLRKETEREREGGGSFLLLATSSSTAREEEQKTKRLLRRHFPIHAEQKTIHLHSISLSPWMDR